MTSSAKSLEDDAFFAAVDHRASGDANHGGAALALPFRGQAFEGRRGAEIVGEIEPLVGVGVETEDVLADQFVWGSQAEQFEEGGIGVENLARGVAAANAIGSVGDQRAEVRLGAAQALPAATRRAALSQQISMATKKNSERRRMAVRSCSGRMLADEREVGAHGEGEGGGDDSGLPAAVPGADHDGDAEQGQAAFGDVGQQNRRDQRKRRAEHGHSIAQDGRTCGRDAE